MKKKKHHFDLEECLIQFSLLIIKIVELIPKSMTGHHFAGQLVRSGTSPALQYAEAQGAESRKDFIHKMKIALKELRETVVILKIIYKKPLVKNLNLIKTAIQENNELISIFVKNINTARANLKKVHNFIIRNSLFDIRYSNVLYLER